MAYNLDEIKDFWTEQAKEHQQSPDVSWSDLHAIELEIRKLSSLLRDGDRVVDIGCANGYSTTRYAGAKKISIRGLDYIPEMVSEANRRLQTMPSELKSRVEFGVGDIMNLENEASGIYDKAIVTRVLINLETWENQQKALAECLRVLKPGGILLLSEAVLQGWRRMNQLRAKYNFQEIGIPPFNTYLDETQIINEASSAAELVELSNFASSYFVGTRVIKPLIYRALGNESKCADPLNWMNALSRRLPAFGSYGTQKLFIFKKK